MRTIHITLKHPPEQLIEQAKAAANKNGVTMLGDANTGCFSGSGVEGQYAVDGESLSITILKKPIIMPWVFIETAITEFFV